MEEITGKFHYKNGGWPCYTMERRKKWYFSMNLTTKNISVLLSTKITEFSAELNKKCFWRLNVAHPGIIYKQT